MRRTLAAVLVGCLFVGAAWFALQREMRSAAVGLALGASIVALSHLVHWAGNRILPNASKRRRDMIEVLLFCVLASLLSMCVLPVRLALVIMGLALLAGGVVSFITRVMAWSTSTSRWCEDTPAVQDGNEG